MCFFKELTCQWCVISAPVFKTFWKSVGLLNPILKSKVCWSTLCRFLGFGVASPPSVRRPPPWPRLLAGGPESPEPASMVWVCLARQSAVSCAYLWIWRVPGNADGHRVQRKQTPQHGNQSPFGKVRRRNHLIWKCFLNWCNDSGKTLSQILDYKTASLVWKFPWKPWWRSGYKIRYIFWTGIEPLTGLGVCTVILQVVIGLLCFCVNTCIKFALCIQSCVRVLDFVGADFVLCSLRITSYKLNFSSSFFKLSFGVLLPCDLSVGGIACVGFGILLWYSFGVGNLHVPDVTY